MKNIDKVNIFSATWEPNKRRVIVQFDKLHEAEAFMRWLEKEKE